MRGLRESKNLILLVVLLIVLVLQPLVHGVVAGFLLFNVLFALTLLSVFLITFEGKRQRLGAVALALPALVCNWAGYGLTGGPKVAADVFFSCFAFAFIAFAIVVILRGIFEEKVIRADQIMGAVCGYLLAGVAWANLYLLAEHLLPGSFSVKQEVAWQLREEHTRRFLFNYFSFATLTTLGYGAITPIDPAAATFSWLEAVFGVFYVAVVVAQLVGLKLAQAVEPPAHSATRGESPRRLHP
jgi:hypothetical protein